MTRKLALMSCIQGLQNALLSWIYTKPRTHGGQQQYITTSLSITLTDRLDFETDQLNRWILEAKLDPKKWTKQSKIALNLVLTAYVPKNLQYGRHRGLLRHALLLSLSLSLSLPLFLFQESKTWIYFQNILT